MDYRSIVEKHPDKYVIACANERDERGCVSDWTVLSADSKNFNEAVETLEHYQVNGVTGAVIINAYDADGGITEAGAVARFFRVYLGMELE